MEEKKEWTDIFKEGMEALDKKLENYGIDIVAEASIRKNFGIFDTCSFRSIERRAIEKVRIEEKEIGEMEDDEYDFEETAYPLSNRGTQKRR